MIITQTHTCVKLNQRRQKMNAKHWIYPTSPSSSHKWCLEAWARLLSDGWRGAVAMDVGCNFCSS